MAADDKSSSSSSTEWSVEPPTVSPASPSHLTHFKPLTPEQDDPPLRSAYSSFVNLFRFNNKEEGRLPSATSEKPDAPTHSPQSERRSWSTSPSHSLHGSRSQRKQHGEHLRRTSTASDGSRKADAPLSNHDPRTAVQLRTALKRLKEIMEGKSQDSDLKQYWMPDSQCKECYDCNEKFTTFRRRHHCRLCGQIFCSRCCNQEIPGKFMGYTGDLRACTYCRKIALSYAHSADSGSIGEDLSALSDSTCSVSVLEPSEPRTPVGGRKASRNIFLEEDLTWQRKTPIGMRKTMIHQEPQSSGLNSRLTALQEDVGKSPARKRSASVTNLSLDRSGSSMVPSYDSSVSPPTSRAMSGTKSGTKLDHSEEERKILLDSSQLKDLWKKICHNSTGMEFQDHRYWLRTYPNCIVGKELVNWLLRNGTISTRAQAIAIGQALVDGRWLDCVTHHDQLFRDEYALYRPLQSTEFSETPSPDSDSVNSVEGHSEPSWFKDIKFDDSDTEQLADEADDTMPNSASPSKRTSVSSFQSVVDSDSAASINLNMEQNNVNFHIKKQSKYPHVPPASSEQKAEYLVSEDGGQNIVISDAFIKESLFDRRVEEKAKEMLFTPLGWHHSSLDQLREENGEKKAMERLLSANHSHMMALLQQLLYSESLSLSWRDIIVPVVRQVVQTVRPDVRNCDDDMDIRQLVHIKKIPGGRKFDSTVVNGFMCTKNIAHKKMNAYIKNPKILLLKCSIEYLYREETKFTCIDPIVLQEREFLKNYVQRIVDVRPNLVLVEKTVSRIAQDMLLEHGITLVINVKPQVLDRVSRMTQGDLVMSMDQLLTKPRLGTCHKFYMQPFTLANDEAKTLMFFEGCSPHLGCSIKLRGASEYELARVKEIIMLMVCVAYHSQLEISFLMDEFAMPPSLTQSASFPCLLEGISIEEEEEEEEKEEEADGERETNGESREKTTGTEDSSLEGRPEAKVLLAEASSKNVELDSLQDALNPRSPSSEVMISSPFSSPPAPPLSVSPPFLLEEDPEVTLSDTLVPSSEGDTREEEEEGEDESLIAEDGEGSETPTPRLFRDPLQDDTGMFVAEQVASFDDRLKSISAVFKQELKDMILCISPFITFKEPFLLTPAGMHCPSRDYFPEQVFLSPLLNKDLKELDGRRKRQLLKDSAPSLLVAAQTNGGALPRPIDVLPCHGLTSTRIVEQLNGSQGLAKMLADYRAKGGRIRQREASDPFGGAGAAAGALAPVGGQSRAAAEAPVRHALKADSEEEKPSKQNDMSWATKLDCLNPVNHQRLCVLFSSSSAQSNNAPNPCVSPWIVTMEFYGKNDLSLGIFLERYCFRPSYQCPNMFCETPMVHHVRRFVHGSGCVQIVLKELDSPVPGYQHTILNYSWCRICKQVTPVVPLSNDSWSMSFAKYLELRFYGHQYTRRANAEPCGHSIHKDYHQYFSYNQMVASFSYTSVRMLEICLPRPKIFIRNLGPSKSSLQQDLKDFSLKVTQVYLAIDDRLTSLKTDTFSKTREEKMEDLFAQKDMEEAELRSWIEKLQARLQVCGVDSPQQLQVVLESLVMKKQGLCEMLQSWNSRLQDLFQQEKGRKRLSVPPSPGRHRQTTADDSKGALDSSPRNPSPVVQNGDKEDRLLSAMPSGSSSSLLPSPGDPGAEPVTPGPSFAEQDSLSIPEDVFDGHLLGSTDSQVKEKSTMKAILANFLPGNSYNPIAFPFDPDKHYLMYEHERVPIAVCEKEPSSIIAFALSCKEYKMALDDLSKVSNAGGDETPQVVSSAETRAKSSPARPSESISSLQSRSSLDADPLKDADLTDRQKKQTSNPHIELQFSDANAKFYCRIYYAEEFHKMREEIMESAEEDFVRSLSHCVNWQARGGKSGAVFYATEDDRFILKQMPRLEVQSFLDFAPHYFTYITGAVQQKRPTALAKILGVYRIGYKNSQNNTEKKLDLLVMENLFYGRKMAQVFDLKGSLRNRNVKTDSGKESCEVVLLDENLLKLIHDNPLYIRSHCKAILRAAIHSDAYFLSSHLIIDYSLLVGRDDATNQLVVGIIDYIRTFTWDKRLEMVVKSTGILGGQGKMPTVVSPELYRARFCEAMDKYFLMVPDHWTGLGVNC
ncbi:1-phosphatidylinositol 3-phosphate 5-kinase isoform X1 [Scophthalmus maximus]|uniref:1-phosphatidylinositol 3-phosphate 5-kinase isoform X1 n=1 Tax=Scophthalmus maximus TaxID=52904 RepID=UPI001FA8A3FA|nr:1-phosphatidylinositol 3-phosphate 5-kinase isoform X1 [Scophthalmus maximus]XP_047193443.1 1-phosphatidylinositol 3-phosphate 5-kinase isoform X1 [Scophthalmus maximus]XP_047193444.1 1-phosphatidylinositol 3-phosphate 5-kinase isoform X1 [Scophthalmus maximus]